MSISNNYSFYSSLVQLCRYSSVWTSKLKRHTLSLFALTKNSIRWFASSIFSCISALTSFFNISIIESTYIRSDRLTYIAKKVVNYVCFSCTVCHPFVHRSRHYVRLNSEIVHDFLEFLHGICYLFKRSIVDLLLKQRSQRLQLLNHL